MKFRNQFLKYRLNCQMSPDGGDAGGGGGDAGNDGDGNGNADGGGDNNSANNEFSHDSLWDTSSDGGSDGDAGQQNANANNNNQQPAQQQTPNERFDAHIAGLDFSGGVNPTELLASIQAGDADALGKALNNIGIAGYRNALVDANKVVQQRVDAMGQKVTTDMSAANATGNIVTAMNEQIPFTKSPANAPIAKLLLTQFMGKGLKPEKAIEQVGKYFQNLSGEVNKLNPRGPSSRASGGFNGNMQDFSDADSGGDFDWQDFLGGPAQ